MKRIILCAVAIISLCSFTRSPFNIDGDTVALRLNNYDKSKVSITVTNEDGYSVYSKTFNEAEIGKLFNFENAYPSTYYITVKDGKEMYRTSVTVK